MIPLDEGVEHPSKIGTQHEDCIRKQRSEAQTELGTEFFSSCPQWWRSWVLALNGCEWGDKEKKGNFLKK